jgi:hypothetical protein
MRFLIRTKIPTEAGNKMVQDPDFLKKLEEYMNKVKPEAAYFLPQGGERSAAFIVNIESNDQIPSFVEPMFQWMGANVEVIPVMNVDDLKKGLSQTRK